MFGLVTKRELLHEITRERRQWETERRELLDRIQLLAGNPWTLPPRPVESDVARVETVHDLADPI